MAHWRAVLAPELGVGLSTSALANEQLPQMRRLKSASTATTKPAKFRSEDQRPRCFEALTSSEHPRSARAANGAHERRDHPGRRLSSPTKGFKRLSTYQIWVSLAARGQFNDLLGYQHGQLIVPI
jgi:hypothetical protein